MQKKAQMRWWLIGLIIAIVALVLFLVLYYSLYGKSTEGVNIIKNLMQL